MNSFARYALGLIPAFTVLVGTLEAAHLTASLKETGPTLKSAGPLAFGPEGILFVADPDEAAIYALATEEKAPAPATR